MQRLFCLSLLVGVCCSAAAMAHAQPALERLEQQVRQRSPGGNRPGADESGEDDTGYLGVVADDRLDPGKGVRIVEVIPGSPAQHSGLKADDLITSVAGKPVRSMEDMARILGPMAVGAKATFEINRDRRPLELEVTLGRRPPEGERPFENFGMIPADSEPSRAARTGPRPGLLGVRVEGVTDEVQAKLDLPSTDGAIIVHVAPDSPAAEAGLPLQGVIVAVDDSQVSNTADLKRLIAAAGAGATVKISYYAQGELRDVSIRLAAPSAPPLPLAGPWRLPPGLPPTIPSAAPPSSDADSRLDLLEERMERLEQRLAELERFLKRDVRKEDASEGREPGSR